MCGSDSIFTEVPERQNQQSEYAMGVTESKQINAAPQYFNFLKTTIKVNQILEL